VPKIRVALAPWQGRLRADTSRYKAAIGGVGSGKSVGFSEDFLAAITMWPRSQSAIMLGTHKQFKEGAQVTFKDRLTHHFGPETVGWTQNKTDLSITIIRGPAAGHRITAWSAETFETLKSTEYDFIWCDEVQTWTHPSKAIAFLFTRQRNSPPAVAAYSQRDVNGDVVPDTCALKVRMWITANPPWNTTHYLYKRFVERRMPNDEFSFYHVKTADNTLLPNREEYIARLARELSPEIFKIEVLGEWGDIGVGRVYTSYSRPRHASRFKNEYQVAGAPPGVMGSLPSLDARGYPMLDPSKPIAWMHDFGVDPRASLICQVHTLARPLVGFQRELVYVIGEIRIRDGSTDKMIPEFVRLYPPGSFSNNRIHMYGDATGINRNSTTADSDWAMLQHDPRLRPYKTSIHKRGQNPPVVDRVNAVNSKLLNALDEIGILIREDLPHICEDLQQTHWLEGTRQLDHGSRSREIFRTHMSDSLGYFIEREWPLQLSSGPRKIGEAITY
jgi:Phage terminase large subunit